jgi:tetratricopeptide (TPR) repeat protein
MERFSFSICFFFQKLVGLYLYVSRLTRKVEAFFSLTVVLVLLLFPSERAEAGPSVEEQRQRAIVGRDLLLARRYSEVESFLEKTVREWPEELLGVFGFMAYYQVRNLENFDFRFDADYLRWEEKGRKKALRIAKDPNASPWDLLMAGGTLGVSGFYRAHNSKWFAALRDSSTAFHAMERAFRKDPRVVDSLLGIGLHDYWRSHFTKSLRFLPFFPDRRKEGIEKMKRVKEQSDFTGVLAEISIAFIDLEEKRYQQVLETTSKLLNRYPRNTIFRMLQGETLFQLKKYRESVAEFEKILSTDPSITKSYLFMGLAYAKEGKEPEKAKELLKKYLELEPNAPSHWRKPALQKLKALEKK